MRTELALALTAAATLAACAPAPPPPGYAVGPVAYYDAYYDGYYGPFIDGYWAADTTFWFVDRDRRWHRDVDHHFQRRSAPGFAHVHGTGVRPR